jgi:hypothetical protein
MKRSARKILFERMLKDRLQWHKRARAAYRDDGFSRLQLDEDALIILQIEVAEMIWRYDLDLNDVTGDIAEMVADITEKHKAPIQ